MSEFYPDIIPTELFIVKRDGKTVHCDHRKRQLCQMMEDKAESFIVQNYGCKRIFKDCDADSITLVSTDLHSPTVYDRVEHVYEVVPSDR